ncbi:GNAT family N-acetyltransferase [Streptomyces sp. NPDC126499]|uniref:GNAT family N-acetyltransferase n=1 Tax=Streptomyces sp. NPDC126499 TaxID=3155314 RepID=UPI0033313984
MHEDAKLSDGVVTLSPLGPGAPDPVPTLHRPRSRAVWRVHGPARTFGIGAGRPVGTVRLSPATTGFAHGDVELSYALLPEARGRGFATRAVRLACAHAGAQGARRAVILVPAAGPAAAPGGSSSALAAASAVSASAVARRAGFVRRGQISHADGTLWDWYVRLLTSP